MRPRYPDRVAANHALNRVGSSLFASLVVVDSCAVDDPMNCVLTIFSALPTMHGAERDNAPL